MSAGAVVRRGDEVLLVQMGYGRSRGRWIIPGGYREPNESLESCAVREVLEETGVRAQMESVVAVRSVATAAGKADVYVACRRRWPTRTWWSSAR